MIDWNAISEDFDHIRKNLAECRASLAALLCTVLLACVEYLLWGRAHLEDGLPLIALLFLATYDQTCLPLRPNPTSSGRLVSWLCILAALTAMATSLSIDQDSDFIPAFLRNCAILCIAIGFSMRIDGTRPTARFLSLHILAVLIIPFYEYLLLEFSYPLRLVSTAVSASMLKLCAIPVDYDGTSMLWNGKIITITDACSGISLLGLLFLLEYLVVRSVKSSQWKKWCWGSLVILWIIIGNALRLLVTFLLFRIVGDCVFERGLHLCLGCLFVVVTSLMIWFSSFIFSLDSPDKEKE
ncbi:MAG: exosortase/archaeosortase family protein [Victivallales bacterium]|nr:exosortase/archaeosortase family protein [Victivallales bacterium]